VAAAAVLVTLYSVSRGQTAPAKPPQAKPTKQFGDDADLMRRLQRHKLVKKAK
jgi:hypothetical protein